MENENKNIIVGDDNSYFDGGYLSYFGHNFVVNFVTIITFGVAHPWVRCWYQKWLCEHTVINGKRMTFKGNGSELFVKYLIWLFLTWLTCGIYAFWMNVALKKWVTENTYFEGEPDNNSFFDGKVGDYFITEILSALALFVPFVGPAWSNIIRVRWFVNHTVIDSRRLTFVGAIGDLFLKYLLWGILTTVTCGIYAWFVPLNYMKWETENTLDENFTPQALNEKANYKTQVHTDAVMLKSGEGSQIQSVKAQMLEEANAGLAENSLEKLNNALRFADILKECGEEFSDDENKLFYNCEILARKLKAERPQTKSKVIIIVIAAIAAAMLFISLLVGAVFVGSMFLMKTDLSNTGPQSQIEANQVCNMSYSEFTQSLEDAESEIGHIATKTLRYDEYDGAFKENYTVTCKTGGIGVGYTITVSVKDDKVDYIEVCGLKVGVDNVSKMAQMIRYLYESIGLGDESDIYTHTSAGALTETYGNWNFEYDNTEEAVNAKLDNTLY